MMRSPSENCFAPNTSTIFILSVAWTEIEGEDGEVERGEIIKELFHWQQMQM